MVSQAFVGLSVTEVVASSITVVAGNRVAAACQEQQAAWHELLLRTLFDVNLNQSCAITLTGPGYMCRHHNELLLGRPH
jgi:hypothetical protein